MLPTPVQGGFVIVDGIDIAIAFDIYHPVGFGANFNGIAKQTSNWINIAAIKTSL